MDANGSPQEVCTGARQTAETLFYEALDLPPGEREAFLCQACGSDANLRAEVDGFLRDYAKAGTFLNEDAPVCPELQAEFTRLRPEEPGEQIGPYKLLEKIGEGGFGKVWVAEQEHPIRRRVALKIIKVGMDTMEVVARFEQERQALALMEHPNIAKVFDAGSTPTGRPYFVMELVRGVRVTDYCDAAQLTTAERLKLFIQVCSAVQHAHQKGIIHRDLKPSNILVTLYDGVPVPKVIDFGVAKATQQQRITDLTVYTRFEQMIGTPLYMAPEQAEMSGFDVDTRSDIYSLGGLLYELLTGRTPFDPEKLLRAGYDEIRRVIREEEPQKPSTFVSTMAQERRMLIAKHRNEEGAKLIHLIRGDLDWIVMKALEKDRSRRYESASSFARDIERHLNSQPVQARPPSAGYRSWRFVRRNRGPVVAGVAVVLALVIGVFGIAWQGVRAEREAARANVALADLRGSAPAFAEQARNLVAKDRFDEAIEKLDYAIRLRPDVVDYLQDKADLLQSDLRFGEAESIYNAALRLRPDNERAKDNAELCARMDREMAATQKLSMESLSTLLNKMKMEQRPAAEMMRISRLLGEEKDLLLRYWLERLKDLPVSSDQPLNKRLTVTESGQLSLDLTHTGIADLTPLEGMPLGTLVLSGCDKVEDLSPLCGMPLHTLLLDETQVTDLSPLSTVKTLSALALDNSGVYDLSSIKGLALTELRINGTQVTDLAPLHDMPLKFLELKRTKVSDLTPLAGMLLQSLDITNTSVADLDPLRGMPLRVLSCDAIAARDFSPITNAPLEDLNLSHTYVEDLSFLRGMPLKILLLSGCSRANGYKVLAEVKTLEVLLLPSKLAEQPEEEIDAIEALRSHPALRQIQIGSMQRTPDSALLAKAEFWKHFERDLKTCKALQRVSSGSSVVEKVADGTWAVSFGRQPVSDLTPLRGTDISQLNLQGTNARDLSPLKGMPLKILILRATGVSDLSPLQGAPIAVLDLFGTNVTDLSPLAGMPLTQLVLQWTKVTDLTPLKNLPLTALVLDGCPPGIDLSPLAQIETLRDLTLPPKPKNLEALKKLPNLKYLSFQYDTQLRRAAHTAEEFWNGRRTFSAESLARDGKFSAAEALLRKEVQRRKAEDSMAWLSLGAVIFAKGDKTRYQAFCRETMAQPVDGIWPGVAVKVCLLGAESGISLTELEKLMEQDHNLALGWRLLGRGLLEYRAGRYSNARTVLRHIHPNAVAAFGGGPAASAILSMCYFREQDIKAAKAELSLARQEITPYWPGGAARADAAWWDCLIAHLLLQEAEMLIDSPESTQAGR